MALTKQQLFAEAITLDPGEREALAEELLLTVDGGDREALDAAWAAEIDRRLGEYDRGEVRAAPPDEMFRRLREKYTR